jgi:hypothetical protein
MVRGDVSDANHLGCVEDAERCITEERAARPISRRLRRRVAEHL